MALYLATDMGEAASAIDLHQQHAEPVAHLGQCQGGCPLLAPVGFPDQKPHGDQCQRHVMMPALPGPHLVPVHAHFTLAAFKAGFNADASGDDPRQLCQRGRRQLHLRHPCRREVILVAIPSVLIHGITRGLGLHRAVVHAGTPGDHQPLRGSRAFAFQTRLHAAFDQLNPHRAFLAVSHRQPGPHLRLERFSPICHRLPGRLRRSSAPCIFGQRGLQVTHRGGAGHAQHVALATLAQCPAKLRVAPQLIITRHPAVWHLIPPPIEHLQTLLGPRVILHFRRHVAFLASVLVPCPLLGKV